MIFLLTLIWSVSFVMVLLNIGALLLRMPVWQVFIDMSATFADMVGRTVDWIGKKLLR